MLTLEIDDDCSLDAALAPARPKCRRRCDPVGVHATEGCAEHKREVRTRLSLGQRGEEVGPKRSVRRHHGVAWVEPRAVNLIQFRLWEPGLCAVPLVRRGSHTTVPNYNIKVATRSKILACLLREPVMVLLHPPSRQPSRGVKRRQSPMRQRWLCMYVIGRPLVCRYNFPITSCVRR